MHKPYSIFFFNFRGRGSSSGFYRGGRGRGGNQGGNQGFRGGRGGGGQGGGSNRGGGFQPGRPTATKKEPLKFEGEYDFDKANEEFKEVLDKLQVVLSIQMNYLKLSDCSASAFS